MAIHLYVRSHVPSSPWTPAAAETADDEEEAAAADAVPGSVLTRLYSCLIFFSSFTPPAAAPCLWVWRVGIGRVLL